MDAHTVTIAGSWRKSIISKKRKPRKSSDYHKVKLILTCLGGVTLNLMSAKPQKLGSCECRELRSPLNTHLYVGHFYRIRSWPSRKMMAHKEPGKVSPQEPDNVESRGSGKGGKHKQSNCNEERLTTKRKRDTTEGRANRSNGDAEEETLPRNRGKSKMSHLHRLPTNSLPEITRL
jgi:hypothetical protein